MSPGAEALGIHHSLSTISDIDSYTKWVQRSREEPIEEYLDGYRILVRACLQSFQDKLTSFPEVFHIDTNLEFRRARGEIADIDSLRANSEAANLLKYIDRIDDQIHSAHNAEYLSEAISNLRKQLLLPFEDVLDEYGTYATEPSEEEIRKYLACFSLVTYANDATRGYPEAFQYGWLDNRSNLEELDENFESYRDTLFWAYSILEPDVCDIDILRDDLLAVEDWKELDLEFRTAREALLDPFEDRHGRRRENLFELNINERPTAIENLLSGAPDPVVSQEKQLNRIFLWDFATRANDVLAGPRPVGIFMTLFGLRRMRERLDTDTPIQFRRFVHPTGPGNDYSYAIDTTGWGLEETGMLRGWVVFTHAATDYSGQGSHQYRMIETHVKELESEGVVEIEEMTLDEDSLVQYLDEHSMRRSPPTSTNTRNQQEYDGRRLTEIIRGGEGERTEFKRQLPDNSVKKLGTEVAALANHKGGVLLLGVDDQGEIYGVEKPDNLDNRISGFLRSKLKPPLAAEIHIETAQDVNILIVDIPDVEEPVAIDYTYYVRSGRNKERMLYSELKEKYD
ncbi:ATP-binding protein [Halorubrum sp. ASP1]|uniref:AlbA family DNA-binding domain-containing protein n=1 Tax=Halorubrum sp. ASP1 TaxID=2518114 RepID=UPI0010F77B31|nr:ATP-binding protein [Halorubrum sp. ASP1]TKX58641.1 ATP-binding protein [Halorubrum sp. ASP1]